MILVFDLITVHCLDLRYTEDGSDLMDEIIDPLDEFEESKELFKVAFNNIIWPCRERACNSLASLTVFSGTTIRILYVRHNTGSLHQTTYISLHTVRGVRR